MSEYPSYLIHYGVKGQHWGDRRYQYKDGTYTSLGKERRRINSDIGKRALSFDNSKNNKIHDKKRRDSIKTVTGKDVESVLKTKKRTNPDEQVLIKKGKTVRHITTSETKIKPNKDKILFVTSDENDKKLYSSVLASRIIMHTNKTVKAVDFELKRDLKAPSKRESIQLYKDLYKNNKKEFIDYFSETLSYFARDPKNKNQFLEEEKNPDTFRKRFEKNMKKSWLENEGYLLFNAGFTDPDSLKLNIYKQYRNELKNRGYNALVDDNDSKQSLMDAKIPLIILDEIETLGNMKVTEITNDSILNDYNEWVKSQKN